MCGKGCSEIINALEGLERKRKKKKEKEKEKKQELSEPRDYDKSGTFRSAPYRYRNTLDRNTLYTREPEGTGPTQYGGEPEGIGPDQKREDERTWAHGGDGKGVMVKEGQKLNQKQLDMLVSAAEESKTSTNPLCKEESPVFRVRQVTVITTCGRADVKCKNKQPVPKEKVQKNGFLVCCFVFLCLFTMIIYFLLLAFTSFLKFCQYNKKCNVIILAKHTKAKSINDNLLARSIMRRQLRLAFTLTGISTRTWKRYSHSFSFSFLLSWGGWVSIICYCRCSRLKMGEG